MARWCFVLIVLLLCDVVVSQERERQYNEMRDSPTVYIAGCGNFPSVRVVVAGRETEGRGFIRGGRTFMPARETLERLGGKVVWVQRQRAFYAQFLSRERTIRVETGSRVVRIYRYNIDAEYRVGRQISTVRLNAAPFQCEGRVFIPVRAATEALGGSIDYDRSSRTVRIYPPQAT